MLIYPILLPAWLNMSKQRLPHLISYDEYNKIPKKLLPLCLQTSRKIIDEQTVIRIEHIDKRVQSVCELENKNRTVFIFF